MPPTPRPHAFHLQLPPHHRAPKDQGGDVGGLPYVTIHAYNKAQSIWKMVKSLEVAVDLYCEVAANKKTGDDTLEQDEGDDEADDCEEMPITMPELVKKCSRLHTQLTSLYALKHNGFTQFELCQIILKVLTLLSATVDVRIERRNNTDGEFRGNDACAEVQQSVSAMVIDDTLASHGNKQQQGRTVSLHFDNMGYILGGKFTDEEQSDSMLKRLSDGRRVIDMEEGNNVNVTYNENIEDSADELNFNQAQQHLEQDLSRPLALPAPAREALLSVALLLLSKKEQLRSVSNSAIFHKTTDKEPHHHVDDRWMLILDWRSLLRMLLRTAPYLDEHKAGTPPMNSPSRTNAVLKRTVQLIRSSRRFFDQGIRPPGYNGQFVTALDATARVLWSNLKSDILYHSHSNSCFRALILLYLFHPSKCTSAFYLEVMPQWMSSWSNVDRCPEFDFLWMVMFCRARKYVGRRDYDWGGLRRLLLTHAGYWLQIPVGGVSSDKSFPRVGRAGKRSFPRSLKLFVGVDSSYEEGIDFVAKLTKLLMHCSGPPGATGIGNVDDDFDMGCQNDTEQHAIQVSDGTSDILRFFLFVKPYFNPSSSQMTSWLLSRFKSNVGAWTFPLGAFLHYFSYELSHRIGVVAALKTLKNHHADAISQLYIEEPYLNSINIPGHEIVAYLDILLPLCQQALYSKNGTVSHAGETALLYLAQVDPARVTPPMIDFSLRALGVSSVNLSHQAPAALSALSRLLQPALRHKPSIILSRLPEILQLTLAGIDGNDQNKTTRTLIFYRNLLMWIPCGGSVPLPDVNQEEVLGDSGHEGIIQVGMHLMDSRYSIVSSSSYQKAVNALPPNSIFTHCDGIKESQSTDMLMQEAMMAMSDWSLSFLDRIFELLRAAGEQEKHGKSYGPGSSHASSDVALAKNVSRILKETLTFFFASMDEETYSSALRYVTNFITEETLPLAVKDASILCQAVASTRVEQNGVDRSPGLDALVPILTENLEHRSNKTAIYRLRCLAGAVRYGGRALLAHSNKISSAIAYAISKSDDKVLLKTGCKLLRHALASQCEEYPIAQCFHPIRVKDEHIVTALGASVRLRGDRVLWHIPSGYQIDFCVGLLDRFALAPLKDLGRFDNNFSLQQWRHCLRLLRYSLRGCIGLLLDDTPDSILSQEGENCPREKATAALIKLASVESNKILHGLRRRLCLRLIDIMSLIATGTVDCESKLNGLENEGQKKKPSPLSTDPKVCSEVLELSDLLLTRRGAHHKSVNSKSIWRGQKEILSDFVLSSMSNYIMSFRSRSNDELFRGADSVYKDGEDGGKTVSRALLVTRIDLVMQSLTGAASTQIPRRLRKLRGPPSVEARAHLFSLGMTFEKLQSNLLSDVEPVYALEAYEGLIDSLSAMSCHPNINVRGDAIGIVEYAFTRYGWVIKPRIPRLLAAISLRDEDLDAKFGILSCARLVGQVNSQGKRTRLAEAMKGVTKLLGCPKVISGLLSTEENRFKIAERLCSTQRVQSLLPHEELAKFVHYVISIFLSIRSRFYSLPRATATDQVQHELCLMFLLDALADNSARSKGTLDSSEAAIDSTHNGNDAFDIHWKNRLVAAWLLTNFVDEVDLVLDNPTIMSRVWSTCFKLIEEESGQPLQRVSVGLLGRLVFLALVDMSQCGISNETTEFPDVSVLRNVFLRDGFCRHFAYALAFDHREDNSVGGGHSAQWSSGVDEILRDATSNLAPKTLYPFQRISQTSSTFKIQHCQLVEGILLAIGRDHAKISAGYLLAYAKELVASLPSEDQRNQLVASAEIFAGVCRAMLKYSSIDEKASVWDILLLPFLDEAVPIMPNAFISAFFDAIRYGIHHFPPRFFHSLLKWCVVKVQGTLWQHEMAKEDVEDSGKLSDRFTLQSKYLLLVQAVLIELDSDDDTGAACQLPWYTNMLLRSPRRYSLVATSAEAELGQSWQYVSSNLIPCLLNAIGHPYEKCRDHIASCLFRMCYCHRKFLNIARSQGTDSESADPGVEILKSLQSIRASGKYSFREKMRALGTSRKFVACCIHWGDAKHEFSEFIIPLLQLAFESLQPIGGEVSPENHGLEADLVKGYRYAIADMSSSCVVAYGLKDDMTRVLAILKSMAEHECWQVRQASAHFLRCFQGNHKFLLSDEQEELLMSIAVSLLADDRREVSSAAMSVLTGIISILPEASLNDLVSKYIIIANKSLKKKRRKTDTSHELTQDEPELALTKEKERATRQQKSVFFLCAVIMSRPYDVPSYVPIALEALSKHSFEQRASLGVREVVKMCCSEFKRTHTDNWEAHRKQFTQVQLEALDDVVSTPHYYA
eukprot:CCRYP_011313-RA/>CCRYP_011313-RA protein AED:0.03 eAED:0.02 QI:169/0.87/0.88/1/1/1/9/224/2315